MVNEVAGSPAVAGRGLRSGSTSRSSEAVGTLRKAAGRGRGTTRADNV